MHSYVIFCIFICVTSFAASETLLAANATWNGVLDIKCKHTQSWIYIKEALFGSMGENSRKSCLLPVGSIVRSVCNRKLSCKFHVIRGPNLNPESVNCTKHPSLYVQYVCINRGASIMDLTYVATKWMGYVKPAEKETGGYRPALVQWTKLKELCSTLPRFVQFELVDIDFDGNCDQQQLSIEIKRGGSRERVGPFCQRDLDQVPKELRVSSFVNTTDISFNFTTNNAASVNRGFLLKFIGMQCFPLPETPNTLVEYSMVQDSVQARISCRRGFFPGRGALSEVTVRCSGNTCVDECDYPEDCDCKWKPAGKSGSLAGYLSRLQCLPPSAFTTTVATTTVTTTAPSSSTTEEPTTVTTTSSTSVTTTSSSAATSVTTDRVTSPSSRVPNTTTASVILPQPKQPGRKRNDPWVIAGIIGGVITIVALLIIVILLIAFCRKTQCSQCCCLDSLLYDKATYADSQALSHASTSKFGDSTLALRHRPPSTASTQMGHMTLTSVNRSSVSSSTLFSSQRRSKRKTLPHPSMLGYGHYDETAPLFPESVPRDDNVFSPSIETYLEPDRRPSASRRPSEPASRPHFSSFTPKAPAGSRGVYQVYDETRSSRNALDRFDAPVHNPRQSMGLISNHYYSRGEDYDGGNDSDSSVYEVVEEGQSSVCSTPREIRRHAPAVQQRNAYVQPPELPARPSTMRRSEQRLPAAPLATSGEEEEEEDGYQPVNCANRVNV